MKIIITIPPLLSGRLVFMQQPAKLFACPIYRNIYEIGKAKNAIGKFFE